MRSSASSRHPLRTLADSCGVSRIWARACCASGITLPLLPINAPPPGERFVCASGRPVGADAGTLGVLLRRSCGTAAVGSMPPVGPAPPRVTGAGNTCRYTGAMSILVCGSLAYDTIMVFPDQFRKHILPDRIHMLNVSFMVPDMRREFGGTGGNIAYNLKLL